MIRTEREVRFAAADGWELGGILTLPRDDGDHRGLPPGAVLVPASRHERDAWGATSAALAQAGVGSLRIDIRGRGTSRGALDHGSMGPLARRKVALDVAAAVSFLADSDDIDGSRLAVVCEQDTAVAAVDAAVRDSRVVALALLSARNSSGHAWPHSGAHRAVLSLVSTEDREGLRATVDAYLSGAPGSRIEVFRGLGIGITMASVRQFEHPDAEAIEDLIGRWVADRLRQPGAMPLPPDH